ncbi:MAG: DUF3017 domain-containing protein [Acidothermus cellulolyticus]|jgi:hypothetical protein|nr:DUF3017 domain-containing protein [Acidothermus cellulolyticus]
MDDDRRQEPPKWHTEVPLALALAGVGVGLFVIGIHHFRWGVAAIAVSLLGAAFLRLILPARRAGLLVVRSRFVDVVTLSTLGGALLLLDLVTRQ